MLQRTPFLNSLQLLAACPNILGTEGLDTEGLDSQTREYFFYVAKVCSLKDLEKFM